MNDQQINDMVSRFLAWRLPEDFNPDGGISFAPTYNTWGGGTARAEPVGTNLFSFDQAKQMVLHMLGEANSPAPDPAAIREALEGMLSHSCVADAGADMKDAQDHEAERKARAILALIAKGAAE